MPKQAQTEARAPGEQLSADSTAPRTANEILESFEGRTTPFAPLHVSSALGT